MPRHVSCNKINYINLFSIHMLVETMPGFMTRMLFLNNVKQNDVEKIRNNPTEIEGGELCALWCLSSRSTTFSMHRKKERWNTKQTKQHNNKTNMLTKKIRTAPEEPQKNCRHAQRKQKNTTTLTLHTSSLLLGNWSHHYENTPIQIYWTFYNQKRENFQIKNSDIFHITAQNIDCWYSLEPPHRGCSNEYPQSMGFSKIRKIMYTPVNHSFTI